MIRLATFLAVAAFVAVACGSPGCYQYDEPEPAPTAVRVATVAPAATPMLSPTPVTPVPASPRLIVSMPPPFHQVRLPYQTFQSATGPLQNLYDYLIGKNRRTGEVENTHLAESWHVSPDARTWTFNLKEGIPYYMNSEPSGYFFSPEDVRHTWLLNAGINSDRSNNSGRWQPLVESVDNILVDGNALIWNLDVIQPDLHEYLSEEWTFGLISKAYWDDVGGEDGYIEHPIGTGAWSFAEYEDNYRFLLVKNYGHYRKEPEFNQLQFLWTKEPSTTIAQLVVGEAHIGQFPSDQHGIVVERGFEVSKSTLPSYHLWGVIPWYLPESLDGAPTPNYDDTVPTRNKLVREALNLAIDRNHINETIFNGDAIPSAVSHMAEWWPSFQDRWAPIPGPDENTGAAGGWPYPYRPGLARELLIDADYPNGFTLDLFAPANLMGMPEIPDVGEAIVAMWENIGIVVNFTVLEWEEALDMVAERTMNGKVFLVRWTPQLPSDGMGWLWRKAPRPSYEYPFITEWKQQFDVTAHPAEREYMIQELGDFWYDNYLSIPLLWVFPRVVYNPDILEGYEVNHLHFGPTRYHEYTVPIYR